MAEGRRRRRLRLEGSIAVSIGINIWGICICIAREELGFEGAEEAVSGTWGGA